MTKRILLLAAFLWAAIASPVAQNLPEPPSPQRLVNDFAALLSASQRADLEKRLADFDKSSSSQITIVTVDSLQGLVAHDYATRLGEKWRVGQKDKDNGIVILVKPKNAEGKGQVAISVGYGLEGAIPDATASRIIRNEMIPAFQSGDYYAGISGAADVLIDLARGEYTAEEYESRGNGGILVAGLLIAILILALLRRRGGGSYSPGHRSGGGGFFIFPGGGTSFGSFSGGSGSFGGFGGFGGGSFGGGGASGDW